MIGWIKSHAQWIAGGIIAILAAFYLLTHRGGGGSGAAGVVSFPPVAGGGGGAGPTPGPQPTGSAQLPYSPDYSILGAIKDDALRALYEQEFNLQGQINQATLTGNDSLLGTLQGMLGDVQQQIQNYQPGGTSGTPASGPGVNFTSGFGDAISKWLSQNAPNRWNMKGDFANLLGNFTQVSGLSQSQQQWAQASFSAWLFNAIHYGYQPTSADLQNQFQYWVNQAAMQPGNITTDFYSNAPALQRLSKGTSQ